MKINSVFILKFFSVFLLVLISIFIRFNNLTSQFPTVDDTGVAWTLTEHLKEIDYKYVTIKVNDRSHEDFNSIQFYLLRKFKNLDLNYFFSFFIIPQTWTYAPLQFVFTGMILDYNMSYLDLLFWGRFPSFVFSCVSIFLLISINRIFYKEDWFFPCIVAVLIYSLSLESIIYSSNMSNYSANVFSVLAVLSIFIFLLKGKQFTFKSQIFISFLLSLCFSLSYQVVFILPGFFLYLFIQRFFTFRGNLVSFFSFYKDLIFLLIFFFGFSLFTTFPFLLSQYSRGSSTSTDIPIDYYFFNYIYSASDLYFLPKIFLFYSENFFESIRFLFLFQDEFFYFNFFYSLIIIFFIIYSFFFVSFSTKELSKKVISLLFFGFVSFLAFVTINLIPFSPSRHVLFLFPIFIIFFTFGLYQFLNKYFIRYKNIFYSFFSFLILCLFFSTFFKFNNQRKDLVSAELINNQIDYSNPYMIVIPNYFILNKFFSSDYSKEFVNYNSGYTVYKSNDDKCYNKSGILVIRISDNYFDFEISDFCNSCSLQYFCEYNTNVNLDNLYSVKNSQNRVSFKYFH